MNYKIYLKKINGHWFIATGTKGYVCTTQMEKFLDKVNLSCVFINDYSNDPLFSVKVNKDKDITTEFLETKTGEVYTVKQCPKMFEDLNLPTQFYINRGDS